MGAQQSATPPGIVQPVVATRSAQLAPTPPPAASVNTTNSVVATAEAETKIARKFLSSATD